MLVIRRSKHEEIVIAGNVRVKVLGIYKGSISLGIMAPKNVPVLRSELLEDLELKNKAAADAGYLNRDDMLEKFRQRAAKYVEERQNTAEFKEAQEAAKAKPVINARPVKQLQKRFVQDIPEAFAQ